MGNGTNLHYKTHDLQVPRPSPDVVGHIHRLIDLPGVNGRNAVTVTVASTESAGLIHVSAARFGAPLDNASEVFASKRPAEAAFVLALRLANHYRSRVELRSDGSGGLCYSLIAPAQEAEHSRAS